MKIEIDHRTPKEGGLNEKVYWTIDCRQASDNS